MVPRDLSQLICVGYSRMETETTEETHTVLEAMTLINTSQINEETILQEESQSPQLLQPSFSNDAEKDTDGTSVMSSADLSSTPPSSMHHRRLSSTTSALTITSATGSSSTKPKSRHQKTTSEISTGSSINSLEGGLGQLTGIASASSLHGRSINSNEELAGSAVPTITSKKKRAKQLLRDTKARLMLSQEKRSTGDNSKEERMPQYSLSLLDFRPLCPCIANWMVNANTQVNAIFVGNADNASLLCYVPSAGDPRSLVSILLPEEHFSVEAPVMALDFCTLRGLKKNRYTLAMACQDGTIQLVTWESSSGNVNTDLFSNISSHRVIVDGPLACVKLDYNQNLSLRVTVGSMCGYVCQLLSNQGLAATLSSSKRWDGPFVVAQDLWNSLLDEEDSVLAVDSRDNYVAVGTQIGRCILYATQDSENYVPVWHCLLPYSIHGISIIWGSDDAGSQMCVAVTTRQSFHLFRAIRGGVVWKHKPSEKQCHAEIAWDRIQEALSFVREQNAILDNTTKTIIGETLYDILNQVEDAVPSTIAENGADAASVVSSTMDDLLNRVDLLVGGSSELGDRHASERSFSSRGPQLEYSSSEDSGDDGVETTIIAASIDPPPSAPSIVAISFTEVATQGEGATIVDPPCGNDDEDYVLVDAPTDAEKVETANPER